MTPPTGLTPTAGDAQVALAWSHASPGDVAEYVVEYRCPSGSGSYTEDARPTSSSEIVSGLTNGVECDFRVAAEDAANNLSAWAGPVQATPEAAGALLRLEDSADWGPGGAVVDLTDAVPQFSALSEDHGPTSPALPLDTSSWSTVTLDGGSCTPAGFAAAVASVSSCNTVVDVSACSSIVWDQSDRAPASHVAQFYPSACKIGMVLRGHPTNRTRLEILHDGEWRSWSLPSPGSIPGDGRREGLLLVGQSGGIRTLNSIAAWTWTGGQQLNSTEGTVSGTFVGLYPGDVIMLRSAQWSGAYATNVLGGQIPRNLRKVVCSVWSTGAIKGSGCDGKANGTIVWDRPITKDYRTAGPYYYSSNMTGQQIQHVARLSTDDAGTYPITSGNTLVHVGIENIEFVSDRRHIYQGAAALQFNNVAYGWIVNSKLPTWANDALMIGCQVCQDGAGNRGEVGNVLVARNEFDDPIFARRGTGKSVAMTTGNPAALTIDTSGPGSPDLDQSNYWTANTLDWGVWIDPKDCNEPGIVGYHDISIVTPWASSSVTVGLSDVNGAGLSTTPDCYVTLLRTYDSGTIRLDTNAFGHLIEDNSFENTRINIMVQGASEIVVGYNEMATEAGFAGQRHFFDHEGGGDYLVEGNVSNAGWIVPLASAGAAGPGRGPDAVYAFNEFVRNGVPAAEVWGGHGGCQTPMCAGYSTDTSDTDVRGEFQVWLGNIISGYSGADIDAPLLWNKVRITGNLWRSFDMTPNFSASNPESIVVGNSNNVSEMPSPDRAREFPDSLYRKTIPPWWCAQSGAFPNVGAPHYTATNSANLPAKIRRAGGLCTPL